MKMRLLALLPLIFLNDPGSCQENARTETEGGDNTWPQQRYLCPPDFLRLGNSCYYYSTEMATWHAAHFACRDRGSQLVALETEWEDGTMRNYLEKPEFASLNRWVGGTYNWYRRQWTWGSSAAVMLFNGFLTSEFPSSSRWHCVYLSPNINYRWNHSLCTTIMHYICEAPQIRVPDPNDIVIGFR